MVTRKQIIEHDHIKAIKVGSFTLSTINTTITQPQFQTKQKTPRNCDPPSPRLESSTHNTPHNSPQQGPSPSIKILTSIHQR